MLTVAGKVDAGAALRARHREVNGHQQAHGAVVAGRAEHDLAEHPAHQQAQQDVARDQRAESERCSHSGKGEHSHDRGPPGVRVGNQHADPSHREGHPHPAHQRDETDGHPRQHSAVHPLQVVPALLVGEDVKLWKRPVDR